MLQSRKRLGYILWAKSPCTRLTQVVRERNPADYFALTFVQYKMTIANREKYMKNVYKRYRKALKSFSDVLTLERLLNGEDREISYLLYKLQCIMDDTCSIQFYSDYGDFESPEQLMRRSKDGDVYYIVAAFDYHF